jgi:hypothetical protein
VIEALGEPIEVQETENSLSLCDCRFAREEEEIMAPK